MKLLLDQDVYEITRRLLGQDGHDILTAAQIGLSEEEGTKIIEKARSLNRILITRDKDFGNLVFVQSKKSGVIFLRMVPATQNAVHEELKKLLENHSESEL